MASLLQWITDLLWPLTCLGCATDGTRLCAMCAAAIPYRPTQDCIVCARPARDGIPCRGCQPHTALTRLIAIGSFKTPLLAAAIHTLKYKNAQDLAVPLGDWLASAAARADIAMPSPLIVPVPLHPARLRERGYNQAVLLAQRLRQVSMLPLASSALLRTRHTDVQVKTHSRWERLENMSGAFTADATIVAEQDIILIDDVCTTGATLNAAAVALCDAGARSITAVVLARG